jgi:hypothetical protein
MDEKISARTGSARAPPLAGGFSHSATAHLAQDLNSSIGPSLDEELNIDKNTLETLKGLYLAKEKAVMNEDFDEAKKLKVAIDRLKSISSHLG